VVNMNRPRWKRPQLRWILGNRKIDETVGVRCIDEVLEHVVGGDISQDVVEIAVPTIYSIRPLFGLFGPLTVIG
jgi:hypothetical protein